MSLYTTLSVWVNFCFIFRRNCMLWIDMTFFVNCLPYIWVLKIAHWELPCLCGSGKARNFQWAGFYFSGLGLKGSYFWQEFKKFLTRLDYWSLQIPFITWLQAHIEQNLKFKEHSDAFSCCNRLIIYLNIFT